MSSVLCTELLVSPSCVHVETAAANEAMCSHAASTAHGL